MRYPLANSTWDEAEIAAIQAVVASGMFSMNGKVAEFERAFAVFTRSRYCVMVNSGSSANLLMVAALRYRKEQPLMPGDEVIVPAVSWSTTYFPLHQYGLHIKFVDIDPETLNYDLTALAAAISPETRAIMAVNLLGNPNDFAAIRAAIGGRDIILIEDNCESMGAVLAGRQTGTFGIMGTFSAFFSHHISTMEGGMIVTDDEELYHILLSLRAHGWTRNLPRENRVTTTKSADPFEESFRFVLPGYNVRPLEMSGAIGLEQVRKLPRIIAERRANAARFQEMMARYPFIRTQKEIGESSWFGFSMLVKPESGVSRAALLASLRQSEVDVRPIVAGNFAKNEVVRFFDHSIHATLPNAEYIDGAGLFVGNHHYPLKDEFAALAEALDRVRP